MSNPLQEYMVEAESFIGNKSKAALNYINDELTALRTLAEENARTIGVLMKQEGWPRYTKRGYTKREGIVVTEWNGGACGVECFRDGRVHHFDEMAECVYPCDETPITRAEFDETIAKWEEARKWPRYLRGKDSGCAKYISESKGTWYALPNYAGHDAVSSFTFCIKCGSTEITRAEFESTIARWKAEREGKEQGKSVSQSDIDNIKKQLTSLTEALQCLCQ